MAGASQSVLLLFLDLTFTTLTYAEKATYKRSSKDDVFRTISPNSPMKT